jgi:hypothetical protein
MALSIKTDVEDIPSILKLIGLGGSSAAAEDTGGTPPVDASLGGEAQPTAAPDASQGQPAESGPPSPPASTHDGSKPPTKLLRLQQALGADQPAPAPPLQVPGPNGVPESSMPPADLAASLNSGQAKINPTFRERHPNIFKTLGAVSNFVEDAGPGIGAPTFGQGFAAAAAEPARKAKEEADLAISKANLAHTQAATDQMKTQVTLPNGLTVPFALAQKLYPAELAEMGKNSRNQANLDSRESIAGDKNAIALRAKGLKANPAGGAPVPLTRDEMSETEQATLDLKQSQQEATAARAELDRNKNNPDSPAYKAAMGRLAVAQKNSQTAAGRLGLEKQKYSADYLGLDAQGNALPGAQTDEQGRPIGPRMANANNPSADRTRRGDLAANAIHNLNNVEDIIKRRGDDLFGPIMGRITSVRDMIGSDDPDIAAIGVEVHNYALAANGAHGVRSQQAISQTEDEILKEMKRGATGAQGGINAAKDSLLDFVKDQQLGKKARPQNPSTPKAQATPSNASDEVYASDGKTLIGHVVNGKYVALPK